MLTARTVTTQWMRQDWHTFTGRQDNVQVRQAALIALGFNLLMVVAAIVSMMLTVPAGRRALAKGA
jgi:DHA2 family multidrug resistance protein-like MFS transporter